MSANSPTFGTGPDGVSDSAQVFNGTTDFDRISNYDPTGDRGKFLSVFCCVKGVSQSKYVFSHFDFGTNQRSWVIYFSGSSNSNLNIILSDDGTADAGHRKQYVSSITVGDDDWHHVGFTWNAGTLKLYIDGIWDENVTKSWDDAITTLHPSTADLTIGSILGNNLVEFPFAGSVSNATIFNYALTNAQVVELAQSYGFNPLPTDGLVGYWSFDRSNIKGTTVIDKSGNGYNGLIYGCIETEGISHQALWFNGTSDYIQIDNLPTIDITDAGISWNWWAKTNGGDNYNQFNYSSNDPRITLNGNYSIGWFESSSTVEFGVSSAGTSDDNWHMYTLIMDSTGVIYYYIDGSTKNTGVIIDLVTPSIVTIGKEAHSTNSKWFHGAMDEVRIYQRPITQSEITQLYNQGI